MPRYGFSLKTHYIVDGLSRSDRDSDQRQGQDHEGTILRKGRRMSLGKSNLKDAQHAMLDG